MNPSPRMPGCLEKILVLCGLIWDEISPSVSYDFSDEEVHSSEPLRFAILGGGRAIALDSDWKDRYSEDGPPWGSACTMQAP